MDKETCVRSLEQRVANREIQSWVWAKLSGLKKQDETGFNRQDTILALGEGDELRVTVGIDGSSDDCVLLETEQGDEVANLAAAQNSEVLKELRQGTNYSALICDMEVMDDSTLKPVIALVKHRVEAH